MKLRIRGNSLRLRLTRTEVASLADSGEVCERTAFGGDSELRYCLRSDAEASRITARFADARIDVIVPAAIVSRWAASEQVSIESEQPIGSNDRLTLLVEKDFACLVERPGEDDSDAYPHPSAG